MKIEAGGYTLQGRRGENQDAHAIVHTRWGVVAAVCDGLGGHEGGREAAELAARAVWEAATSAHREESAEQLIQRAVRTAHREVRAHQKGRFSEMMTTIVVWAWRAESPTVCAVGHLGDSRAYLYRPAAFPGAPVQLTKDHAAGRHIVLCTVGSRDDKIGEPEVKTLTCLLGDTFLLCTDGLHGTLDGRLIEDDLRGAPPVSATQTLCERAFAAGSQDNITAVVVRLVP